MPQGLSIVSQEPISILSQEPITKPSVVGSLLEAHKELGRQVVGIPVGAIKGLANIAKLPFQLAAPPRTPTEELIGPPGLFVKRLFVDPQVTELKRSREEAEEGRTVESLWHSITAGTPMVGPMASYFVDKVIEGKAGEAVGELALYTLGPKAIRAYRQAGLPGRIARAYNDITQAFQPSSVDFRFEKHTQRAVPEIVKEARLAGAPKANPVPDVQAFNDYAAAAMARLGGIKRQFIDPNAQSIIVDGRPIAARVRKTITPKMLRDSPAEAKRVMEIAERYDKDIPLAEAEELLHNANVDLAPFYQRSRLKQITTAEQQAAARDLAVAEGLREGVYKSVTQFAGKGLAEVQATYGALKDLRMNYSEPLATDIRRYGGKNLPGMVGETAFDVAAGGIYSRAGALVRGGRGIARMFQKGPDEYISRAFRTLGKQQYPPTPFPSPRRIVGQLPSKAGGPFALPGTATPRYPLASPTEVLRAMTTPTRPQLTLPPAGPGPEGAMITQPPKGYSTGFEPPQVGGYKSTTPLGTTPTPPTGVRGGKGIQRPQQTEQQLAQQLIQGIISEEDVMLLGKNGFIPPKAVNRVIARVKKLRRGLR